MGIDIAATKNVLRNRRPQLLARGNVVATGVGYKVTKGKKTPNLSIVCSVVKKLPLVQLLKGYGSPTIDGILQM
jgi:hypothetical protein